MKQDFFSVVQAQKALVRTVKPGGQTTVAVAQSAGYVLAENLKAPQHSPAFDQSAMDGYAFRYRDYTGETRLKIAGVVKAGAWHLNTLKPGEAFRIYTGAGIPPGADTVVMQEKTKVENGWVSVADTSLAKGANIRAAGSQLRKGATALQKNTWISAGASGFIASLGVGKIRVYKKPTVGIIVTGDELVPPGKTVRKGQVPESNSGMLAAALHDAGISEIRILRAADTFDAVNRAFGKLKSKCDFILFTGGISVGDLDFTGKVVEAAGVKKIFYKVKQKPGKPVYFGKLKNRYVFGLPGNPASVLTCFYIYVLPALRLFQNHPDPFLPELELPVRTAVFKKPGLSVFLKACVYPDHVSLLPGQESYILAPFARANGFIVFDEAAEGCQANDRVRVCLFGPVLPSIV